MDTYTVKTDTGHIIEGVHWEMVDRCLLDAIIERNSEMTRRFDDIKSAIIKLNNDEDLSIVYTDAGTTVERE